MQLDLSQESLLLVMVIQRGFLTLVPSLNQDFFAELRKINSRCNGAFGANQKVYTIHEKYQKLGIKKEPEISSVTKQENKNLLTHSVYDAICDITG